MTATLTLSMEIELGWGKHDLDEPLTETLSPDRSAETRALERLLRACDRLAIPMTFAVAGHLLEASCPGAHDGPHRPGWFDADPGTSADEDPLFYAPDLVENVVGSTTEHEVCTHTYSHVLCDEVDEAVLNWELERVRDLHERAGLGSPRSFVAPRHRPVDDAVLAANGIEVLRRPFRSFEPPERSGVAAFLGQYVPSHSLASSAVVDGVLETYCEASPTLTAPFLANGRRPPRSEHARLPRRLRQRLHRWHLERALDAAVAADAELHLWTHLYNVSNDVQWPPIRAFLETVAERRDAGDVDVRTMASLADGV